MALCEVYTQTVTLKYKSTLCSKSAFFAIFTTILIFLLPFLIAFRSHGFWLKNAEYREQPTVLFKYDYLLHIETDEPHQPILCSNLPVTRDFDRCTVIKSREEDNNRDGKQDALLFEVEVSVPPGQGIYSLQLLLVFDYILQKQCLLHMESLGFIQHSSNTPGYKFDFTGDLKLVQKQLLSTRGRNVQYTRSVFNLNEDSGPELDLGKIIRNYGKRNISTKLENSYSIWTSGIPLDEPFKINVHINYPEESVKYKPSFWQVMKWAWIQYFSLLFIFVNIFQRIKGYVFRNNLMPVMRELPWKKTI